MYGSRSEAELPWRPRSLKIHHLSFPAVSGADTHLYTIMKRCPSCATLKGLPSGFWSRHPLIHHYEALSKLCDAEGSRSGFLNRAGQSSISLNSRRQELKLIPNMSSALL
ncbi:hypothetical protein QE152_g29988 [Popillia japonica]|uniref:Uncharacterized protein n=1 Tax=Popillia japonica TaxID=7064 RepID=A0AAW1JG14_POPJA